MKYTWEDVARTLMNKNKKDINKATKVMKQVQKEKVRDAYKEMKKAIAQ